MSVADGSETPTRSEDGGDEMAGGYLPISDDRCIELAAKTINPLFLCTICDGYVRDAYTIKECLHSFCKSCIFRHFSSDSTQCPRCLMATSANPMNSVVKDHQLNSILMKLLPSLIEDDNAKERAMYESLGLKRKGSPVKEPKAKRQQSAPAANVQPPPDSLLFILQPSATGAAAAADLPPLDKPFMIASRYIRIVQLQKYISLKLKDAPAPDDIELFCNGRPVGKEHALHFVNRTMWHENKHLELQYARRQARHFTAVKAV